MNVLFFLFPRKRLHPALFFQSARLVPASFLIDEDHRQPAPRVTGSNAVVVHSEPALHVIRNAGIECIVAAFQDVE